MNIIDLARICHEANRAYCQSLGDMSQAPWEEAPDWQKTSAVNGVKYHLSRPDITPEQSHKEWLKEKAADGWKWGPNKDAQRKEHPCFLPYFQLPLAQQLKDELFTAIVKIFRSSVW